MRADKSWEAARADHPSRAVGLDALDGANLISGAGDLAKLSHFQMWKPANRRKDVGFPCFYRNWVLLRGVGVRVTRDPDGFLDASNLRAVVVSAVSFQEFPSCDGGLSKQTSSMTPLRPILDVTHRLQDAP